MAKDRKSDGGARDVSEVVSIVGPGMSVTGDCETEGTLRVEGRVEGSIEAGKAVVIGEDGVVVGDIITQDVVVAGRVRGSISAESRVELQASCHVEGDIVSRRVRLEEGGRVDGRLEMTDRGEAEPTSPHLSTQAAR